MYKSNEWEQPLATHGRVQNQLRNICRKLKSIRTMWNKYTTNVITISILRGIVLYNIRDDDSSIAAACLFIKYIIIRYNMTRNIHIFQFLVYLFFFCLQVSLLYCVEISICCWKWSSWLFNICTAQINIYRTDLFLRKSKKRSFFFLFFFFQNSSAKRRTSICRVLFDSIFQEKNQNKLL